MRRACFAVLCCLALAVPAAAQSNVEVNAGVQFDFLNPGARSLAMGSAFIGMADDATAAFVNPAGLRALSRREISFEGRGRDFTIPVSASGRLNGTPSNTGVDRTTTIVEDEIDQSSGGLSFLSFVYPRSRWAIAAYRHELANFDSRVQTGGFFYEEVVDGTPRNFRRLPMIGTMDLSIVSYGVSGSFNVTPQVSVGAGLAFYDFSMESRTDRFDVNNRQGTGPVLTNPPFTGEANYTSQNLQNYQQQTGDDTQVGVNIGAMFAPSRMFQLGVVFRQGPEFDLNVTNTAWDQTAPAPDFDRTGVFHVPHVFGVGALIRPMTNGTFAIDVTRVGYSEQTNDFIDIFTPADSPDNEAQFYSVEDATEVHLGFEYLFPQRIPIAVRAGYWFDPEHALVYNGATIDEAQVFQNREDDQHHFSFGGGAVFGRFEVNGGADFADRATTVSFSAVVRF